jgi:hypothetical protein
MNVVDFVGKFAGKSGIDFADKKYEDIVRKLGEIAVEIPDEVANKIAGSLMNMDDAKNNLSLKSHFSAEVLDASDDQMRKVMDKFNFTQADRDLVREASSFKRIKVLADQIDVVKKREASENGTDKEGLHKKINELTTELSSVPTKISEIEKKINSEWEQKLTTTQLRSFFNGKKWANEKIPLDVNVETGLIFANRELEKSGAKIVSVNGTLKLVQLKDESLDWISPTNEKPTPEQFLDGILADNKLLAVTTAPPDNGGGGNNPPVIIPGGPNGGANATVLSSMNEDFEAAKAAFAN